jgi:hypothetical protein
MGEDQRLCDLRLRVESRDAFRVVVGKAVGKRIEILVVGSEHVLVLDVRGS